jgi:hypothetical protein
MTEHHLAHRRRQRRWLIGLALLFFAPLFVSFYLYYGPGGWRPGNRVNRGDLIDPPRPLPAVSLTRAFAIKTVDDTPASPASSNAGARIGANAGAVDHSVPLARANPAVVVLQNKWTLLYWGAGDCTARCRTNLYNTRQVRAALNRDMDRVQRVFIANGECCDWRYLDAQHPDLLTVRNTPAAAPMFALLPAVNGIDPATADRVYLIDPLGNLMMSYAPNAAAKGMLEDLKRLLGLSHVG